jgi:hypothetical protein
MEDVLSTLADTPIPTILVISGVIFLVLAISDQIAGKISVNPGARKYAALIGGILVVTGIALYLVPTTGTQISAVDGPDNDRDKPATKSEVETSTTAADTNPAELATSSEVEISTTDTVAEGDGAINKSVNLGEINGRLLGIRFYEAGYAGTDLEKRIYRKKFAKAVTDSVWCEIWLEYPAPKQTVYFQFDVAYRGAKTGKKELEATIAPDWTRSYHYIRLRSDMPVGRYDVDVYINGEKIHSDFFEIYG